MNKRTLRWLVFTILLCTITYSATVIYIRYTRTVPFDQCSAVYQRYAHCDGLKAAYYKDKRIPFAADSLGREYCEVDMTVIMADDSLVFVSLLKEWGKTDDYVAYLMSRSSDETFRLTGLHPKGHPECKTDSVLTNNDVVAIFPAFRAVAFFHTTTEEQIKTFLHITYYTQNNINKTIKQ